MRQMMETLVPTLEAMWFAPSLTSQPPMEVRLARETSSHPIAYKGRKGGWSLTI